MSEQGIKVESLPEIFQNGETTEIEGFLELEGVEI
jgi:hypothetical protein